MSDSITLTSQYKDGWSAHRLGVGVEENPYSEETQSYSNKEWGSGWCQRFSNIKHNHNFVEADES
jgi:hypothetical protein